MEGMPNDRAQYKQERNIDPIPSERWNSMLDSLEEGAEGLRRISVEGKVAVTGPDQIQTIIDIQDRLDDLKNKLGMTQPASN